jgi:hypothetical protein
MARLLLKADKVLSIDTFVACGKLDDTYFDRPYYLLPASPAAEEAFALLREGMRQLGVAAIAHTVLFRRLRPVLIRARPGPDQTLGGQVHGLQPHRYRQFKLYTDPKFVAKLRDVVGPYVDPPAHAIVLSVDEKSQIQALDRT